MQGKTTRSEQIRSSERGNAILEFALIMPILFGLFVATVEFTRMFRIKEMMAQASREASHLTFRECFDSRGSICNVGENINKIDACLDYFSGQITAVVEKRLPGVEVSVSIYAFDAPDPANPTVGIIQSVGITHKPVAPPTLGRGDPSRSEFSVARVSTEYGDLIRNQQLLVFAEIYYESPPLFGGDGMNFGWLPGITIYDVTVF